MNNQTIIKHLEKALACKENKELRLRIEVLLDMLKEEPARPVFIPTQTPVEPLRPYYSTEPTLDKELKPPYKVTSGAPKINGAGAITSANSEQINYTRPKGT